MKTSFFIFLLSVRAFALTSVDLERAKTKIEFLAIGTPSAVKIRGHVPDDKPSLKGKVNLDGTKVSGTATLPLDAFDTGIGMRNEHMKKKYLEIEKYPTAVIEITKLELPSSVEAGDVDVKDVAFEGVLQLHGQKKPIKGTSAVTKKGKDLAMTFDFKFPITEYGMEEPSFMGIKVNKPVEVSVAVNAVVGT